MAKKIFALLLILPLLLATTGCWGKKELSEIGIVLASGIDLEPDGSIRMTVLASIPIGTGTSVLERSTTWVGTATGKTIMDASRNLGSIASKKLLWLQNRFFIVGEDLARKGLKDILDYASRIREVRYSNDVLIAEGKAYDILQVPADIDKSLSAEIEGSVRNSYDWSGSYVPNLKDTIMALSGEAKSGLIGKIRYEASQRNTFSTNREMYKHMSLEGVKLGIAYITGSAAFKGDRMVGWLDADETRGYMYLTGKAHTGSILVSDGAPNGSTTLEVDSVESSLVPEISAGNRVSFTVKLKVYGDIVEDTSQKDIRNMEAAKEFEKSFAQVVTSKMKLAVAKAQKDFDADIFDFAGHVFRKYPGVWKKIGNDWDKIFPDIQVNYDVQVNIDRIGMISRDILD